LPSFSLLSKPFYPTHEIKMVKAVYRFGAKYQEPRAVAGFITLPKFMKWTPSLTLWGASAGVAVVFFADSITRLRNDVYSKLPVIGSYYDDSVDPEDTPF